MPDKPSTPNKEMVERETPEADGYVSPLGFLPPSADLTPLVNLEDGQEKLLNKILADELPDEIKNNTDITNSNFAFLNKMSGMTNIPSDRVEFFEQKTRDYYRSMLNNTDLDTLSPRKIASMKNVREYSHMAFLRGVSGWEREKQKEQIISQRQEVNMPPPEQPSPRNNGGGFANFLFGGGKGGK